MYFCIIKNGYPGAHFPAIKHATIFGEHKEIFKSVTKNTWPRDMDMVSLGPRPFVSVKRQIQTTQAGFSDARV